MQYIIMLFNIVIVVMGFFIFSEEYRYFFEDVVNKRIHYGKYVYIDKINKS